MKISLEKPGVKICSSCILPGTFPGIKFDSDGVCKYCIKEKKQMQNMPEKRDGYRDRLDRLIGETRGNGPSYDVIMAYSGGKDSSYTLKLLREKYDLRILALTFDNHFVSREAVDNIYNLTDALDVDLITFRPPWSFAKEIFSLTAKEDIFPSSTLMRASSICTSCIGIVKSMVLKTALEMSVPLLAYGWSPGQAPIQSAIMKNNPAMTMQNQKAHRKVFSESMQKKMDRYFLPESYYDIYEESFPYNIHPLAFWEYDEDKIVMELSEIGWRKPEDTDTNSSNCLLNALGNHCHLERNGFHPYVWEIANMVRAKVMTREEGIEKIYSEYDYSQVESAKERLGI